ncbi:glucosylceramidase [Biomphalaria glabrata]|nr:glucosylceramidase [Biomphalaria glabrata]
MASLLKNYLCFVIVIFFSFKCSFCLLDTPCSPLIVKSGYIVCVCNATYCDTFPSADPVSKGNYVLFTTSQSGIRANKQILPISKSSKTTTVYHIKLNETRQSILGFGGAFTDAAGINIAKLPAAAQTKLINSYYSKDGLEYTIGRVPIASCDFSTRAYSYDDVPGDFNLSQFTLAPEDFKYKIPFIRSALSVTSRPIKFFASPWSAPAWMKTEHNMTGQGTLIGQPGGPYYKAWATYFIKFLEEYEKNNISFWGITAQNEPTDGLMAKFPFQSLGFTPEMQRDFIKLDLGPALQNSSYKNTKLMILDDQKLFVVTWMKTVLSDPEASKYISGVAVHWYVDGVLPSDIMTLAHNLYPDKFLFGTEACEGSMPWQMKVDLGAWDRAVSYARDIIIDLNNWVTGWTDWNLALDLTGGPNWVSNYVDSPIIVNYEKNEFYKQPMYYILGHFSKYVVPDSIGLNVNSPAHKPLVEITAFLRPDKSVVVVILNLGYQPETIELTDDVTGYIPLTIPGNSIQTVVWWLS